MEALTCKSDKNNYLIKKNMKRLIVMMVLTVLSNASIFAQSAKELAKQQQELNEINMKLLNSKPSKDAKKQEKKLVKEGWQVLGKPKDREDAKRMLSMLSGKTHRVLTGVWICSAQKCDGFVSENLVTFQTMSEEEIEAYIATGEPMDKAGAYGIQGEGGRYIAKLEGDFYAVMGLPREQLKQFVEENFQK